jgi:ElaB/YqjD/DUF883 family membrane-anchored ribosome-binding protein
LEYLEYRKTSLSRSDIMSESMNPTNESDLKAGAQGVREAVSHLASETSRYAKNRLGSAKDSAAAMLNTAKSKADEYNTNVIGFIQKNPWASVGIATVVGITLGLLLRGGRRR